MTYISHWTPSYHGVSHYVLKDDRGKLLAQGTIEDHNVFVDWFVYSWTTHKTIMSGTEYKKDHRNYLDRAKKTIEKALAETKAIISQ